MTISHSELQDVLLGLLGTRPMPGISRAESPGNAEWQSLMEMVNQHRLAPLLHRRLQHEHADFPVPDTVRKVISDEYKEWAITSLMIQRELIHVHRLLDKFELLQNARAIICVAGMEGALTSVVAGLVSCPVVGVPTSVGYGSNFGGLSALLAMLNSCAPGVAVVNIDNGFGAAQFVYSILDWQKSRENQ